MPYNLGEVSQRFTVPNHRGKDNHIVISAYEGVMMKE